MVFKKKKKLKAKPIEQEPQEEPEEEFEEEQMEDEEEEEEEKPEVVPQQVPIKQEKQIIKKPDRLEIEDMIEGHLIRAVELFRLLRGS